jgi:hypothetical protein
MRGIIPSSVLAGIASGTLGTSTATTVGQSTSAATTPIQSTSVGTTEGETSSAATTAGQSISSAPTIGQATSSAPTTPYISTTGGIIFSNSNLSYHSIYCFS